MEKIVIIGKCDKNAILGTYSQYAEKIEFDLPCENNEMKYAFDGVFFVGEYDKNTLLGWLGNEHLRISKDEKELEAELNFFFGIPKKVEIERKILVEMPKEGELKNLELADYVDISQAYVKKNGSSFRVRKRGKDGDFIYIKTQKTDISAIERTEIEERISEEEYLDCIKGFKLLSKRRWLIINSGKCFELDIFPFWNDKALLEIELKNADEEFEIPPFLKVIGEVTFDKNYRNSCIAQKYGVMTD